MFKKLFILSLLMTFFIFQNSFAQNSKSNKEVEKTINKSGGKRQKGKVINK